MNVSAIKKSYFQENEINWKSNHGSKNREKEAELLAFHEMLFKWLENKHFPMKRKKKMAIRYTIIEERNQASLLRMKGKD